MRYTVDTAGTELNQFNIVDTYTGSTLYKDLDAVTADNRLDRLNASHEEAMQLAEKISSFVNRSGSQESAEFVQAMSRQHRTLQQGFTGLCVAWIEHLAALQPGQFDGRNQSSVELAKEITSGERWERKKYLPYV
jgi:hypothetical protein